ncbi:MAG: glycosyltransferase, partial [Dehalococcoidia bacterium]|nr:glycosyltransferase [Dehalococcoidia bacterium]
MRIALVGPFALEPKGTSSGRALPLASALARRGHQVVLVVPPWDNRTYSGQRLFLQGVQVRHISLPPRFPPLWYPLIVWRTLSLVLEHRPQAIHIFKPKAFSGLAAMACWLLKKVNLNSARLVLDTDDWEGKGGWNELAPYGPLQRAFFAFQERWVLRHAESVTVASRALISLVAQLGVSRERIAYLPNGTAGNGPFLKDVADAAAAPTLLLYTRFFEFQARRMVSIFQEVLAQVPEAKLLVLGQGLHGEEKEMSRLLQEAGVLENVELAGWVQPEHLPDYFRRAQVALYPLDDTLLNRAKCPLKLVELMEAGFPVVADNVGQAADYIVH